MEFALASRSDQLAMRMQRHEDAESGQQRDHGGAAVADQRQGHADYRKDAADHAGIDEYIHEKAQGDGAARQARKGALRLHRQVQRAADHHAVQRQNEQLSHEPEFLADDGEDEIGGALGEKFELRLTAVHVALAEQTAGADGDLRLDDVIPGAQAVGLGIEKGQYTLALIVVDEMPRTPGGGAEQRNGDEDQADLQPRQQHDDEAGGRDQQSRAQVRLRHDHGRWDGDQDSHD